jgi:hypothetical protein
VICADAYAILARDCPDCFYVPMGTIIRNLTDTVSNVKRLEEELRAGVVIQIPDAGEAGYTLAPSSAVVLADDDDDEDADMVSLPEKRTGIKNTIFTSTKGRGRHAARIKIAIDPPDSLNAASESHASMRIHDFEVIGAYMRPALVEQLKQWIDLNREALMAYWNEQIDTQDFLDRVRLLR